MIIKGEQDVTTAVLAVMENTRDPRLREIMISLIKHLHGFVREVRLTEDLQHGMELFGLRVVNPFREPPPRPI